MSGRFDITARVNKTLSDTSDFNPTQPHPPLQRRDTSLNQPALIKFLLLQAFMCECNLIKQCAASTRNKHGISEILECKSTVDPSACLP
jgi:hypothetical protein